jgi:hypothetical protein
MLKNTNTSFIILIIIFTLAALATATAVFYVKNFDKGDSDVILVSELESEKFECEQLRKLDGLCFEDDEPFIYSVMIDNHVSARPPVGLGQASLVYESIVEMPITRLLAIFYDNEDLDKIGPVRSARPFYVDWAREFNAPYLHVGGSQQALEQLARSYEYDLNEFAKGQYFWRDYWRSAPHNVLTSNELVRKAIENNEWDPKLDFKPWIYKQETPVEERGDTDTISIDYQTTPFYIEWQFDAENNLYKRFQGGAKHKDGGDQIATKNIAVMYTASSVIDTYGRRKFTTIGSGKAVVFQDGNKIEGTWRRPNLDSRTRFYNKSGAEVRFNPGTTWIEVIPTGFTEAEHTIKQVNNESNNQ